MKQRKINLRIGDTVFIISGVYKNEVGQIMSINKKTGKLIVQGVNTKSRHIKPRFTNEIGKIEKIEGPIDHSNVKLAKNKINAVEQVEMLMEKDHSNLN